MLKVIGAIILAAIATGCSLAPESGPVKAAVETAIDTGIEDRRAYNDRKADTLLTLPCDISVGAYYRLANSVQQKALVMLCSGKEPGEAAPVLALPGAP